MSAEQRLGNLANEWIWETRKNNRKFKELFGAYRKIYLAEYGTRDYYKAVWCRDAAYILKDQFLSGHSVAVLKQLKYIWNKQIGTDSTKLIYGRGSPKTNFTPMNAESDMTRNFYGALPTTIFDNFSEVYALNPDIDSTALMIYASTWILTNIIRDSMGKSRIVSAAVTEFTEYLIPFLFRGIDFLTSRDEDNDGLLEQDHNEDWMDTVLRDGKVVYSQACWLMALTSFANLLFVRGKEDEAQRLQHMASQLVDSIENNMWSEEAKCYIGLKSDKSQGNDSQGILYQDIVFYAFAMTEMLPHIVPNILNVGQLDMDPKHSNRFLIDDRKALNDNSVIEFRDDSWWSKASLVELEKLEYTVCSVDAPLLPKKILNFNGTIYLRSHGSESWYNYLYSEKELKILLKGYKRSQNLRNLYS